MALNISDLTEKINISLEELRPHLHADGGDMELVEITQEGTSTADILNEMQNAAKKFLNSNIRLN